MTRFADLHPAERVAQIELVLADHPEPGAPTFTRPTLEAMRAVKLALVDDAVSDEQFEELYGEWRAYAATLSEHDADAGDHSLRQFVAILDGLREPPAEEDEPPA
jgi:hypothetical protein